MSHTPQNIGRQRRGAILVVAIVVMLVLSLLGAEIVRTLVLTQRHADRLQSQSQAFWLAESALDRARAQLAASGDYAGETWQPEVASKENGDAPAASKVTIAIEGEGADRVVRVEAIYPDDPLNRVSVERTIPVRSLLQDRLP